MERVTDHQFALVDGKVRHVPGGVDEYLRLLDGREGPRADVRPKARKPVGSAAQERILKKEIASTERKLETLCGKADAIRAEMAGTDPADYLALLDVQARLKDMEQQISELEDTWLEQHEKLLGPADSQP
jgi:hypothetical protein